MAAFDGCKVVETTFDKVGHYQRFFTENGRGYAKTGFDTCCDDYSLKSITIDYDAVVYVKENMK